MATETISRSEAALGTPLQPVELSERLAPRVDSPVEDDKPLQKETTVEESSTLQEKPRVRRIIDEEGGTTTATVSSTSLEPGFS